MPTPPHAAQPPAITDRALLTPRAVGATLAALVGINSVNPSYGGPPGGEAAAIAWAARFLADLGLEVEISEALPGRPNLRARLAGREPGPGLLFETHLDTVSTAGMTIEPFAARVGPASGHASVGADDAGRLWGRGATDAKGQAAAMLHALAAWARSGQRPPRTIELALVVDEEFGFGGAEALLRQGITAAGIVIGEPTGLRVVTTHKGVARWWVRCEGRAAHAARPSQGVNAISAAAELVVALDRDVIPALATRRAPLLEPPTLNIAMIEGGIQANTVPPGCRVQLERRLIPGETPEQARAEVQAAIDRLAAEARAHGRTFKAVQEPPTLLAPPVWTDPESALAVAACAAAGALGGNCEAAGVDYATDAAVLAAAGIPLVIVGPGSIDQAHTADESASLDEIAAGARYYAMLMAWEGRP